MLLTSPSNHNLINQGQKTQRRLHFYERGEEIPLISQGVWQVNKGVVQLVKFNPQGEETLLGWVHSDNFFGLWFTSLDSFQAKSLSDVHLQWYSITEIEKNSVLAQAMLSQVVKRIRQSEALLAIAGKRKVEDRLVQLLKLLAREMGESRDSGIRLKVRLTHQNLANAISTTRVTITRLLGDLQKQGFISFDSSRHIVVCDHNITRN
ncbi:Crp/Fnr family transcriptional regulator [Geminocystis sp. NIES-3709]|uniref:Crp/Fnr family transcriptional regulator n=1 Tax=Geminocystis sp. NIES-3709 TaxID=1617448 RepID=UPI0005FC580D|nr:Crp/Fnr family transcriptional regulator [Geminocystis sp. NIES-3709]BAQ65975.1 global nitrogen regulatory protein [Geminocystis sp. NIES-3709]